MLERLAYFQLVLGFALVLEKIFELKPPPKTPAEDKLSRRDGNGRKR